MTTVSPASFLQSLIEYAGAMDGEYRALALEAHEEADVLAILLTAVRDLRADLADLAKSIEADLIASAGAKRFIVPELGEVQIRKTTRRTGWDHKSLWNLLAALALDERTPDPETGEFEPREQAVARVLGEACNPSWRVTVLREHGIDETEYCSVDQESWSVQLPPRTR